MWPKYCLWIFKSYIKVINNIVFKLLSIEYLTIYMYEFMNVTMNYNTIKEQS